MTDEELEQIVGGGY
ncbi:bacteriocin [Lactobacillus delbrueckii]